MKKRNMQSQTGLRVKIILSDFNSIWRMSPGLIFFSFFFLSFCTTEESCSVATTVATGGRWRRVVGVLVGSLRDILNPLDYDLTSRFKFTLAQFRDALLLLLLSSFFFENLSNEVAQAK